MRNLLRNILIWKSHLLLCVLVLFVAAGAIYYKAPRAVAGILWGSEQDLCSFGLESYCVVDITKLSINFGVYDFNGDFEGNDKIALEHIFIDWGVSPDALSQELTRINSQNRWPIVTVEPFTDNPGTLLPDIYKGTYDERISAVCMAMGTSETPVFVRFAHEMENVTGRYPWATTNSADYISAYKHFVDVCRASSGEFFYVWSPAGNDNLQDYWPGREYVDYIGLSVYAFDEYEQKNYGRERSFNEIFSNRYDLVKGYDRPILIAELGVNYKSGQREWLRDMYDSLDKYPLLKSALYFNAVDSPEAWGRDYSTPNWQISPKIYP